MKKVILFYFPSCPYCRAAIEWMETLQKEHPELAAVTVERIDEKLHPEISSQYDYWYVPTFFVDGLKVHEGAATKEIVEGVLRQALA